MDAPCPHPAIYDRGECCGKCPTPPQDSVSDVERLQHQLRLAAGRLHWAATVAAKNDGAAALLAKWSEEADAALAVPINKIGEDAK